MKTIALVDDSDFEQKILTAHLQGQGFKVFNFLTAVDFFKELQTQIFDIVILDVLMPEINGLKVLEHIRSKFDQMVLPVVMLSAMDSYDYVEESVLKGANEYMVKPLDFRLFDLRMSTHIKLKELFLERQENERQKNVRSIVEKYHHELLNPLTIAMIATDSISEEMSHAKLDKVKEAHLRLEETIRKIYQVYKKDLE